MKKNSNIKNILSDRDGIEEFHQFDLDQEWKGFSDFVKEQTGDDLMKLARKQKLIKMISIFISIALLVGATYLIYHFNKPEPPKFLYAQTGEYKDTINLVDGSTVYLFENSKLKYPVVLEPEIGRNLVLDGNAEFDVAKNDELPFKVINKEIFVEVLGTIFSVEQADEGAIEIENKEGSVKIAEVANEDNFMLLKEGESFQYKEGQFTQTNLPEPEPEPEPVIDYTRTYTLYQIYEHLFTQSNGNIELKDNSTIDGRAIVRMDLTQSNYTILRRLKRKGLINYKRSGCRGCYDILAPE